MGGVTFTSGTTTGGGCGVALGAAGVVGEMIGAGSCAWIDAAQSARITSIAAAHTRGCITFIAMPLPRVACNTHASIARRARIHDRVSLEE